MSDSSEEKRGLLDGIPPWQFALRAVWVAVRVVLAVWLMQEGAVFFYQGF